MNLHNILQYLDYIYIFVGINLALSCINSVHSKK